MSGFQQSEHAQSVSLALIPDEQMTDFEYHEGNSTAVDGFCAYDNGGRGGKIEDHSDSKSPFLPSFTDSSTLSRDKDKDRDRHHRNTRHTDHSRDPSDRRERGNRDDDDYSRSRNHDYDK